MDKWMEGVEKMGYWEDGWMFELMDGGTDGAGTGNGQINKGVYGWLVGRMSGMTDGLSKYRTWMDGLIHPCKINGLKGRCMDS